LDAQLDLEHQPASRSVILFRLHLLIVLRGSSMVCWQFALGWLAYRLSTPFAVQLPAGCATVEGVTRAILRLNYGLYVQRERTWNEKEVWQTLHDVIVDELSVNPDAVRKEAEFVRDLLLD
jgi:hypothetical protein